MNLKTLYRKRKAVSGVVATIMLIAITITAAGIISGIVFTVIKFNSDVIAAGELTAEDNNNDGLIDYMELPLLNRGLSNANIESISVLQGNETLLWYSFENSIDMNEIEDMNLLAIGDLQQVEPFKLFQIEIIFEDSVFLSFGYTITYIGEYIVPEYENKDNMVLRTREDDAYANSNFPAEEGYSPTKWFLLGVFEESRNRPDFEVDYIGLCGQGLETEYYPYLFDDREFRDGNIGVQSNHVVIPYEDGGDIPGLVAFNTYGSWDKSDGLNWGSKGIAYMWSYIYLDEELPVVIDIGLNGASEYALWLNGEQYLYGNSRYSWYTESGVTLYPGLNLIMVKVSARTDAHFAGQVLLFGDAISSQEIFLYGMWPTINDLV